MALVVLVIAEAIYAVSDLLGRSLMRGRAFDWGLMRTPLAYVFVVTQLLAVVLQLYIFTTVSLARALALFAAGSTIAAFLLGWIVLQEKPTAGVSLGVSLAVASFCVLAVSAGR